ncbi:ATP-dependent Clp protease proteolytic subunit [Limoniibacter endophyticus]|nr:ATP-dependent Clp protease proteolytic subunit [Limoniibacter endophyticus]
MKKFKTLAIASLLSFTATGGDAATNFIGPDDANGVDGNDVGIHFSGNVTHHKVSELESVLDTININYPGTKRINLFINSWGGEVNAAHAAFWAIKSSPIPVQTINVGVTGSAAVEIYCAGANRAVVDGAYFFVHPVGMDIIEHLKPDSAKKLAEHFDIMHAATQKAYTSCMTLSGDEIDTMFRSEFYSRYIGDIEALRIGLSHDILEKLPASAASAFIYDDPKDGEKN